MGKKVVFDEFINLIEWIIYEHKKIKANSFAGKSLSWLYRGLLKRTSIIITDTRSHAEYSAQLMNLPIDKYKAVTLGTDENGFSKLSHPKAQSDKFTVLYYGSMVPLHGAEYVVKTAIDMSEQKEVQFVLVGGNDSFAATVSEAISRGANISYKKWVQYTELPKLIASADICLGGPFGGTIQSKFVITGKVMQFLRMGKPVIVGENLESHIFTDKVDALVIKQADAKALREAILWAFENRSELDKLGNNGLKLFDKVFSKDIVARDLSDLLKLVTLVLSKNF
jgi:glycosyltransferase involved in cell wall biosynthesis